MAPQAPAASPTLTDDVGHAVLAPIGSHVAGGFYAGQIQVDGELFALILSPKSGELIGHWNSNRSHVTGAESLSDGQANTRAMAEAGSTLAATALALVINGHSDWYLPARDELELLYRHFKPTDYPNWAYADGENASSVPAGEEYTETTPAQTALDAFKHGQPDAMTPRWHWSSTQCASGPYGAWVQDFVGGVQYDGHKSAEGRARAVRRLPIQSFLNLCAEAAQHDAPPAVADTTAEAA